MRWSYTTEKKGQVPTRHCLCPWAHVPCGWPESTCRQIPTPRRAHAGSVPSGSSLQNLRAELLTLNESWVLLSGCLQMMTVITEQRIAETMSIKMAHNSTFVRAFFPSTVTMQKMMIRIAEDRKRGRQMHLNYFSSSHDILSSPQNLWRGRLYFYRHHLQCEMWTE